jgi:uncharacterized membrane protein
MSIQIKSIFSGWVEVTPEQALEYARGCYKRITAVKKENLTNYINESKLRGIQFTEAQLRQGN